MKELVDLHPDKDTYNKFNKIKFGLNLIVSARALPLHLDFHDHSIRGWIFISDRLSMMRSSIRSMHPTYSVQNTDCQKRMLPNSEAYRYRIEPENLNLCWALIYSRFRLARPETRSGTRSSSYVKHRGDLDQRAVSVVCCRLSIVSRVIQFSIFLVSFVDQKYPRAQTSSGWELVS